MLNFAEYAERWEGMWSAGLKPGDKFDACAPSPALVEFLKENPEIS